MSDQNTVDILLNIKKPQTTDFSSDETALVSKYEKMIQLKENILQEPDMDKVYEDDEYTRAKWKLQVLSHSKELLVALCYVICIIHALFYLARMINGFIILNRNALPVNIFTTTFWLALPVIIWIWSTCYDEWNFTNRKLAGIIFSTINLCLFIENIFERISIELIVPLMLKIPISSFITTGMVVNATRLLIALPSFIPAGIITYMLLGLITDENTKETILGFRLPDYIDFRVNKEYTYDMNIVRHLDTGEIQNIKEHDRSLHTLIDGTTGTGKTSSCMSVAISDDLDQKVYNITYQKKVVEELLKSGRARLKVPFTDDDFSLDKIEAIGSGKDVMKNLAKYVRSAGITVMSPNASLADDTYEAAKAHGAKKINRLDPLLDENGCHKKDFIGFNPLFISPGLTPIYRNLEIVKKARILADVMQALYEMNGKGDTYFTSLNRDFTSCITTIILLTYDYLHEHQEKKYPNKYPTLLDVQSVINDFSRVQDYYDAFDAVCQDKTDEERGYKKDDYKFVIDLIKNDLLGEGADKMAEQCRGLRVIFNEFLANPLFKDILCSQESIDMDKMLAEGEITVVNYALELGRTDSIAFGLFFALSFNNAVLRRPVATRIPHFYYIDEFPLLLHPDMEQCFTLFRQYNVAMCIAIQTLDQMEKSETTKYLRGVLLGNCAHQFVFGRISTTEMQLYETLGGTKKEAMEQQTISETPISMEDTSMSFSTRTTMQDVSVLNPGKMRNMHFQEVTVFTVNNGSPVAPFYGKVSFLPKHKRLRRKIYHVDWSKYYDTIPAETQNTENAKKILDQRASFSAKAGSVSVVDKQTVNHAAPDTDKTSDADIFLNAGRVSFNYKAVSD